MNISLPDILVICGTLIVIVLILFLPLGRSRTKASPPADRYTSYTVFRDDDRYWRGFLYNNPDDPALFVPRRFGFGWTLNFGHRQAKLFIIAILLLVLLFGIILPLLVSGATPTGCHTLGCHP